MYSHILNKFDPQFQSAGRMWARPKKYSPRFSVLLRFSQLPMQIVLTALNLLRCRHRRISLRIGRTASFPIFSCCVCVSIQQQFGSYANDCSCVGRRASPGVTAALAAFSRDVETHGVFSSSSDDEVSMRPRSLARQRHRLP